MLFQRDNKTHESAELISEIKANRTRVAELRCPECGNMLIAEQHYCEMCGAAIDTEDSSVTQLRHILRLYGPPPMMVNRPRSAAHYREVQEVYGPPPMMAGLSRSRNYGKGRNQHKQYFSPALLSKWITGIGDFFRRFYG